MPSVLHVERQAQYKPSATHSHVHSVQMAFQIAGQKLILFHTLSSCTWWWCPPYLQQHWELSMYTVHLYLCLQICICKYVFVFVFANRYLYLHLRICVCVYDESDDIVASVTVHWFLRLQHRVLVSLLCLRYAKYFYSTVFLPFTICICICISLTFIQRYFLFSPFVFVLNSPNIFCIRVHCSYSSPGNVFSSSNISFSSFDISCICVLYFSFPNCIAIAIAVGNLSISRLILWWPLFHKYKNSFDKYKHSIKMCK